MSVWMKLYSNTHPQVLYFVFTDDTQRLHTHTYLMCAVHDQQVCTNDMWNNCAGCVQQARAVIMHNVRTVEIHVYRVSGIRSAGCNVCRVSK